MGQRHQQFLNVVNPKKYVHFKDEFKMFNGRKKNIVLPFHNQWLFGRGALILALNVLEHSSGLKDQEKLESIIGGNYNSPLSVSGVSMNQFETFDKYINSIEVLINLVREKNDAINIGFHGSNFMGEDEYDIMSTDFRMGDNNDGITIIDTITNKYCFMNVSSTCYDVITMSAENLPKMKPVSAKEYVKAYYPENEDLFSDYYKQKFYEKNQLKEMAKKNINLNEKLTKRFEGFEVLTENEIKKIFPKVYANDMVTM